MLLHVLLSQCERTPITDSCTVAGNWFHTHANLRRCQYGRSAWWSIVKAVQAANEARAIQAVEHS